MITPIWIGVYGLNMVFTYGALDCRRSWVKYHHGLMMHPTNREDGSGEVLGDEGWWGFGWWRLALNGVGSDRPKKVLILMSDTGGGHRASAEAIKAAFNLKFGDEYEVCFHS